MNDGRIVVPLHVVTMATAGGRVAVSALLRRRLWPALHIDAAYTSLPTGRQSVCLEDLYHSLSVSSFRLHSRVVTPGATE